MHGLSMMNFSLYVYEAEQLGCLQIIPNDAQVVPVALRWWEFCIESVAQY